MTTERDTMPNSGCVPVDDGMEKTAAKKLDSPGAKSVWSGGVDSDQDLVSVAGARNRLKREASKSRLKVYIGLLVLLSLGLLTVSAFLLYSYIENMLSPKEICVTAECITAAAMILNSMDSSANPCDDFYQFACGNFDIEHPIPDTDFNEDWFTNRNHFSIRTVREYLEQNDTDEEPRPVHQARVMFRACKDIESLEKLSLSPMMSFLEHLGLPRKPPLGAADATISWQEAVAHIKRHIDKDIFIGFDVMADPVNNTVNRISVGMPSDSSPLPSHNEHSKIKRPPLRRLLARGGTRGKVAWKEYIVKTMNYILEYNNQSSKAMNASVQEAAKKIIDFEAKLINLKENFTSTDPTRDDLPKNMWVMDLQKITDKAVSTSQINWRKYIEVLFDGIDELDINLEDYDKLAVYSIDYLKALMKLLAKTPPSTIFLTVWWEVVFELAPHTTNYMRDLRTDFEEKTIGEVAPASRPTHCAYVVYKLLDVAVGTVKTTESFLYVTKPKVNKMIDDIQDSFIKAVDKTLWIDKATKAEIKEKVGFIKRRIGFPEWMLDNEEVEDYYDTLEMYEKTHLENVLTYLGRSVFSSFSTLHTYNMNNNTGFNPLEVNAAYSVQDNMIFVPLGMIQFPFYHLGIDALNYGAIGSILGHELVHALDTDGRRYDKFGNYRSWWTNDSINAFNQKVSCLVDKYSNYFIEDVDEWVDGNLTLGENIADNGGLRAALWGYHKRVSRQGSEPRLPGLQQYNHDQLFYLAFANVDGNLTLGENIADNGGLRAALWGYHKRVSRQGSEPRLPGLQQYNHDQLFYLAFANIWCENWSRQAMRWTLEGEHAPNYVRVMGTLSNSPEFGKTWKCPTNSEMNPRHKCHVW